MMHEIILKLGPAAAYTLGRPHLAPARTSAVLRNNLQISLYEYINNAAVQGGVQPRLTNRLGDHTYAKMPRT